MRVRTLTLALSLLLSPVAFAQDSEQPSERPSDTPPAAAQDDAQDTPPATSPDEAQAAREVAASDDPDAIEHASSRVPLDEIRRYVGVFNAVRQAYVEPVEDRRLMSSAIRGLLLDLDPHSVYLDKVAAEDFDEQSRGNYDGIGGELQR